MRIHRYAVLGGWRTAGLRAGLGLALILTVFANGAFAATDPVLDTRMSITREILSGVDDDGYFIPGTQEIELRITYNYTGTEAISSLGLQETIPAGLTYAGPLQNENPTPPIVPNEGDTGTLLFGYIYAPAVSAFPVSFTYRLAVETEPCAPAQFSGYPEFRTGGGPLKGEPTVTALQRAPITMSFTRTLSGPGVTGSENQFYVPGQDITVSITIDKQGSENPSALAFQDTIPNGWTYVGPLAADNPTPAVVPDADATGLLEFSYIAVPTFPATFEYTVHVADAVDELTPARSWGGTITTEDGPKASGVAYRTCGSTILTDPIVHNFVHFAPCLKVERSFVQGYYQPGQEVQVTVTFSLVDSEVTCPLSGLGFKETVPAGWTYVGPLADSNPNPPIVPNLDDTGTLDFGYIYAPNLNNRPSFTYTLRAANDSVGPQTFTGHAEYRTGGGPLISDTVVSSLTDADLIKPVITLLGDATVTHECHTVYSDAGATAEDNIDGNITAEISPTSTVNENAVGMYTVTYNVSDAAGNAADPVVRTVIVSDTTLPVIALNGASSVTVQCGNAYVDAGATASDSCAGALTPIASGSVNPLDPGVYTITYNVSDPSGNAAAPVSRTITVQDTVAPIISLNGASTATVQCGSAYTDAGATATDVCDGPLTPSATSTVNVNDPGTYSVTYRVSDSAGNAATPVARTVTVVDTTQPTLTLNGASTVTVECSTGSYTEAGATASDVCDGALTDIDITGTVNVNAVGSYTIQYSVSDSSNNTRTINRTVNVVDTTAPVITMLGDAQVTVECGGSYTDAGATVADACDDAVSVVTVNPVNVNAVGVYTVTYNAVDAEGNDAVQKTRTVSVVDTTSPTLSLLGNAEVAVECGGSYTDAGATATDTCDDSEALTQSIVVTGGPVNTAEPGTYTLIYSVSDAAGNAAPTISRSVVVQDNIKPVISLLGDAQVTLECGASYTDAGATVSDICDTTVQVSASGAVDASAVGTYTITYSAVDAAGNEADAVTRSVTVSDTTPPTLALLGQSTTVVDCGTSYQDAGVTATDACDTAVADGVEVTGGPVNTEKPGVFTLTYNVSDAAGNAAVPVSRTVVVSGSACGQLPCDLENVTITAPADNSRVVIPAGANTAVTFTSQIGYKEDCVQKPVEVRYFLNGVLSSTSSDSASGYAVTANVTEGQYELRADAVVLETGNTVSDTINFSVIGLNSNNGLPPDPFTNLPNEGDRWDASATMPGASCPRGISLLTWFGPCGTGQVAPVNVTIAQPDDPNQTLTVSIPRNLAACGQQAIVIVGISCDLIGLLGTDQEALLGAIPAESALISGGAPFEISIIVRDEANNVIELSNELIAANPITVTLNGMNFTADFNQSFVSHGTQVTGGVGATPLQLLTDPNAQWSDDSIQDPESAGTSLTAQTTSLSVFVPVEAPKVGPTLSITPNPAYDQVFGIVEVGKKVTKEFTVKNIGGGTLVGTATLVATGDAAAAFKILSGANFSLTTGQTAKVKVEFAPAKTGNIAAQVRFNAQNSQVVNVNVKGSGTVFAKRFTFFGCSPSPMDGSSVLGDALMALVLFGGLMMVGRVYRRQN